MTATFTFTADAGTDVITTSAPHGLVTGDGPAATRNVGGALPGGLAAITDYWAIVTGATTLKLATSSANALAGTAINITDAGTGTHTLEIGIPYRRPRTFANGSQLPPGDMNDNFDAWIALYALLTAQSQSVWSGVQLAGALSVAGVLTPSAGLGGVVQFLGGGQFTSGPMVVQGVNSPAALATGDNDDYSPTNLASAIVLRLTGDAGGSNLTGIAGGSAGRTLVIFNVGSPDITVVHEDTGSAAPNRIVLPNSTASVVIRDNGSMTLWYDAGSSRWRVWSQNL